MLRMLLMRHEAPHADGEGGKVGYMGSAAARDALLPQYWCPSATVPLHHATVTGVYYLSSARSLDS